MRAFRIRVFVPHSNDDMGPGVARRGQHEKPMQVHSKNILVVEDLRKEVHNNSTDKTRNKKHPRMREGEVSGLVPVEKESDTTS